MTVGELSVKYDRWGRGKEREVGVYGSMVLEFLFLFRVHVGVGVLGVFFCLWCQSRGPHVPVPST